MQNKLTIINQVWLTLLLLTGCAAPQQEDRKPPSNPTNYSVLVSQQTGTKTNWGYIILKGEKPIIRQFTIPAIAGNIPFHNQFDANLVGNLVLKKLNHSQPPTVTKKELDSLGIFIPTHDQQNQQNTFW